MQAKVKVATTPDVTEGIVAALCGLLTRSAGLLERENATVLNACLRGLAREIVGAFHEALTACGIRTPLYIARNTVR